MVYVAGGPGGRSGSAVVGLRHGAVGMRRCRPTGARAGPGRDGAAGRPLAVGGRAERASAQGGPAPGPDHRFGRGDLGRHAVDELPGHRRRQSGGTGPPQQISDRTGEPGPARQHLPSARHRGPAEPHRRLSRFRRSARRRAGHRADQPDQRRADGIARLAGRQGLGGRSVPGSERRRAGRHRQRRAHRRVRQPDRARRHRPDRQFGPARSTNRAKGGQCPGPTRARRHAGRGRRTTDERPTANSPRLARRRPPGPGPELHHRHDRIGRPTRLWRTRAATQTAGRARAPAHQAPTPAQATQEQVSAASRGRAPAAARRPEEARSRGRTPAPLPAPTRPPAEPTRRRRAAARLVATKALPRRTTGAVGAAVAMAGTATTAARVVTVAAGVGAVAAQARRGIERAQALASAAAPATYGASAAQRNSCVGVGAPNSRPSRTTAPLSHGSSRRRPPPDRGSATPYLGRTFLEQELDRPLGRNRSDRVTLLWPRRQRLASSTASHSMARVASWRRMVAWEPRVTALTPLKAARSTNFSQKSRARFGR